jgi:hypothetical protein
MLSGDRWQAKNGEAVSRAPEKGSLRAVQIERRIVPLRYERPLEVDEILFEEGGTNRREI